MADFYALPTLTQWNNTTAGRTGWSNTSGGPTIAANVPFPGIGDRVFFDANSGPSREINVPGAVNVGSWSTVGAAPMTFTGGGSIAIYSPTNGAAVVDLTGTVRCDASISINLLSYSNTTPVSFSAPGVIFKSMFISWYVNFISDLIIQGTLNFGNNYYEENNVGYFAPYSVSFANVNVKVYDLRWDSGNGGNIYMGSGTWTISSGYGMFLFSPGNVVPQGCTLVLDMVINPSSGWYFSSANKNYHVRFKKTVGSFILVASYFNNLLSWGAEPGCSFTLEAATFTMGDYIFRGFPGNRITLTSSSATQAASLRVSTNGPSRITFDNCNITRVDSSPVGLIYGRGCTLVGSNIIPYFAAPGFASFF